MERTEGNTGTNSTGWREDQPLIPDFTKLKKSISKWQQERTIINPTYNADVSKAQERVMTGISGNAAGTEECKKRLRGKNQTGPGIPSHKSPSWGTIPPPSGTRLEVYSLKRVKQKVSV